TAIALVMVMVNTIVANFIWWRDTLTAIAVAVAVWIHGRIEWMRQMVMAVIEALVNFVVARFYWWRDTITAIAQAAAQWVTDRVTWLKDRSLE
ncbi:hypothetical protein ACI3PL_20570, partial [Lacticaseibacillus paracasei]